MKRLRPLYLFVITAILILSGCQSNDLDEQDRIAQPANDGKVNVTLRISTAASQSSTRATDWKDDNVNQGNGLDEELMNIWYVVMVNDNGNKVERIFVGKPTYTPSGHVDDNREIDLVAENLSLNSGDKYHIYSFANINSEIVFGFFGCQVNNYQDPADDGVNVYEASAIHPVGQASGDVTVTPAAMNALTFSLGANGKVYSDLDKTDPYPFNLQSKGIPMSNVQTYTVPNQNDTKDLIVIRMLAKLEFQFFNETNQDLTIKSITISDLTKNPESSEATLMLLPTLTKHDDMEVHHKDLKQGIDNMPTGVAKADFTYTVPTANQTVAKNTLYTSGTPAQTIAFYVNETGQPTNADKLFYLTVELNNGDFRYALINQSGKTNADNDAWDYIARNDYRIIPVVLDDYKLELIPYDFPAIGVYPASVREIENDLYEMTFHDYGHFHLVPRMTKISDTETVVPYSSETPTTGTAWTLNTNFAGSWKTAATEGGAWLDADGITSNGFYRDQTATIDGDEVGGAPVWYANTSSPQWDRAGGTNFVPFIFGYIADPGGTMTADKKIYHEFRVKLYVNGTYRRDILYRFYMVLSKDQMMYRAARGMNVRSPLSHSAKRH